ncbi:RNA 3'-phosphate cyclase [Candidatus Micrarchaeota archaeon]|nr:RNA 3'-phosphate cyclase [Candidatus Micrarchaeota archaeon]
MITIDGSHGEGGGQIIRTSLTLSAITGKAVEITNIRANRPKPGLAMQHLTAVKAVRSICRGKLEGAEEGSRRFVFEPGKIVGGKYDFNIGTAGSVTLVAQTILPILLVADKKSEVRITGGTHVMKSPGYDYFENVFLPAIRLMGAEVESKMLRSGYYPAGGGEIEIKAGPSRLKGRENWPREEQVKAIIRVANLPLSIAMREKKVLLEHDIEDVFIREVQAASPGNAVTLWKGLRGSCAVGEIGKRAEIVAKEAVDALAAENGDVDRRLADQLLVYAVLAEGKTTFKTSQITNHFRTNADIIQRFMERKIECGNDGSVSVI